MLPVVFVFTTSGCIVENGCLDHEGTVENNSDSTIEFWAVHAEPLPNKVNNPRLMYSVGPGELRQDNGLCGLSIQSALLEDGTLVAVRSDPVRCSCADGHWEITQNMVDEARTG